MTTVSVFYFAACLSIVGRYLWSSKILTLVFSHTMYFLRVLSGRVGWKTECSKVSSTEVHPQLTSLEYFRFGLDFSMLPIVAHFRVGIQTLRLRNSLKITSLEAARVSSRAERPFPAPRALMRMVLTRKLSKLFCNQSAHEPVWGPIIMVIGEKHETLNRYTTNLADSLKTG